MSAWRENSARKIPASVKTTVIDLNEVEPDKKTNRNNVGGFR